MHATIPKGNMGYDRYSVPDDCSCRIILGDPGADSGDEGKSKRAEKHMARRKVKNGEKSPWGQCLTRSVPNGRRRSDF